MAPRNEVHAYVRRLLVSIAVGVILMATTAIWAWNHYGKKLEHAPPLPPGSPPIATPG